MNNYVGIDIGGSKMYMLAEYNDMYIEKKVPTNIDVTKEYIKKEIDDFILSLPFTPKGIGIAVPGLVQNTDTIIFSDLMPCLNGITAEYFSSKGCAIHLINDVKAALIEESNNYPDEYTITMCMIGTGIAASTKTNKHIIDGANGWSGEIGFIPIAIDNEVHTIGSLTAGSAILRKAGTDVHTFLQKLESGDEKAVSIINEAGFYFGMAMATIINMFNPNVIVVGGSTSTYKGYMPIAMETAKKYALKDSFNSCNITAPKDTKRIVALGAKRFISKIVV